jgi:hypothetical protein
LEPVRHGWILRPARGARVMPAERTGSRAGMRDLGCAKRVGIGAVLRGSRTPTFQHGRPTVGRRSWPL